MTGADTRPDPLAGALGGFAFGELQPLHEPAERRKVLLWLRHALIVSTVLVGAAVSGAADTERAAGVAVGLCVASYTAAALDGAAYNRRDSAARLVTAPRIVRVVCFAATVAAAWQLSALMAMP